jgi:uncharacterized surface protein with fasciclin (FAS1) repeats
MKLSSLLTTAAAAALLTSAAHAQTVETTAPAESPAATAVEPVAVPVAPAVAATPPVVAKGDLIDTARAAGQFTTFVKAMDATNLTALVKGNRNLTIFAPTDAAFAALPAGELDRLRKTENATELQALLAYHIVNATVDSTKMKGAKGPIMTVGRSEVLLDGSGASLKANSAAIVQADVRTTNGILHVVDRVLSPTDPAIAAARAEAAQAATLAADAPAS